MNTENNDDFDFYSKLEEFGLIKTSKLTHDGSNDYVKKRIEIGTFDPFSDCSEFLKVEAHTNNQGKNMNTENNDDFDFYLWLSAFQLLKRAKLTEDEWNDYFETVTEFEFVKNGCSSRRYECEEDFWELRKYMIGYWDMGEFNETISSGFTEELAIEWFLGNYQPKSRYAPYVARCETLYELEQRIKSGDTDPPFDGQTDRFEDFSNKYYEALHN